MKLARCIDPSDEREGQSWGQWAAASVDAWSHIMMIMILDDLIPGPGLVLIYQQISNRSSHNCTNSIGNYYNAT